MSNVRLSNESLSYYRRAKNNAGQQNYKPFVSFVRDDDTEENSDSSDSDDILMTPRLKEHSRKILESEQIPGVIPLNLGKRFSGSNNTPHRILQVALEREPSINSRKLTDLELAELKQREIVETQTEEDENIEDNFVKTRGGRASKKAAKPKPKTTKNVKSNANDMDLTDPELIKEQKTTRRKKDSDSRQTKNQDLVSQPPRKRGKEKKDASPDKSANDDIVKPVKPATKRRKKDEPYDSHVGENTGDKIAPRGSVAEIALPTTSMSRITTRRNQRNKIDSIIDTVIDAYSQQEQDKSHSFRESGEGNLQEEIKENEESSLVEQLSARSVKRSSRKTVDVTDRSESARTQGRGKKPADDLEENPISTDSAALVRSPAKNVRETLEKQVRGRSRQKKATEDERGSTSTESGIFPGSPSKFNKSPRRRGALKTRGVEPALGKVIEEQDYEANSSDYNNKRDRLKTPQEMFFERDSDGNSSNFESDDEEDTIFSGRFPTRKMESPQQPKSSDIFESPVKSKGEQTPSLSTKPTTVVASQKKSVFSPEAKTPDQLHHNNPNTMKENVGTPLIRSAQRVTSFPIEPSMKIRTPSVPSHAASREAAGLAGIIATPKSSRLSEKVLIKSVGTSPILRRKETLRSPPSNKRLRTRLGDSRRQSDIETNSGDIETALIQAVVERTTTRRVSPRKAQHVVNHKEQALASPQRMPVNTTNCKNMSSSIDPRTLPLPMGQDTRFNPYKASMEDPVRIRQLMATEDYRVLWLHLLPTCIFAIKVYSPMMVFVISGSIEVRSNQLPNIISLNSRVRTAELEAGILCHLVNTGEDVAVFQTTEHLR